MLEQLRDWNKESSAFSYLWTCDDKPFCRRKDIPNWPRIYQHPWCILPLHWKSPHTCDSCVQRSISRDQRTKHHPQTAKWRALRVNIVNYILVYTEIIVSSFFPKKFDIHNDEVQELENGTSKFIKNTFYVRVAWILSEQNVIIYQI